MAGSIAIHDKGGDCFAQARLQRPPQTAASSRTHIGVIGTDIPAHCLQNTALQNTLVRESLHVAVSARLQPYHSVTHPVSLKRHEARVSSPLVAPLPTRLNNPLNHFKNTNNHATLTIRPQHRHKRTEQKPVPARIAHKGIVKRLRNRSRGFHLSAQQPDASGTILGNTRRVVSQQSNKCNHDTSIQHSCNCSVVQALLN
jgi:hypothetical protein